jgi:thioredoxin reductase (NADPH)
MEQIAPFKAEFRLGRQVTRSFAARADGRFTLATRRRRPVIDAGAVFIAAGAGSFTPRRPKLAGLDGYEGKSVFYSVRNRGNLAGMICSSQAAAIPRSTGPMT